MERFLSDTVGVDRGEQKKRTTEPARYGNKERKDDINEMQKLTKEETPQRRMHIVLNFRTRCL